MLCRNVEAAKLVAEEIKKDTGGEVFHCFGWISKSFSSLILNSNGCLRTVIILLFIRINIERKLEAIEIDWK